MIWTLRTPFRRAVSPHSTFGIIPPVIFPPRIIPRASSSVIVEIRFPSQSRTPGTSVSRMNFSAATAAATSAAAVSPLMLYASPISPTPMGAMTGTNPRASSARRTPGSTPTTSPTSPRSISSPVSRLFARILRARISPPSFPQSPTALPPNRLT
jgi:hypothetical protein